MTKNQLRVLKEAVAKLREDNTSLAEELIPHREALRLWLDSWVIAPIDAVIKMDEDRERRDEYAYRVARWARVAR